MVQSKRKREWACKTVRKQAKTDASMQNGAKAIASTQNGAKTSKNRCRHAKRCKSARDMQIKQSGMQNNAMQEKANAGAQNDACNANGNAMDAMQCFRWARQGSKCN